jgi:L-seryl-tRNA(Ser) seleniumtransferase
VVELLGDAHPYGASTAAARRAIDEARSAIRAGGPAPSLEELAGRAQDHLEKRNRTFLQPVINATGVMIHTNLGRVPLGDEQLEAVCKVASGYSNLEYDLATGKRGTRYAHATRLICELTGAEAALVVNNNAAAVLLTLSALSAGKEVIISRGELVEIGGEFRIPDVMAASGTKLVEVGTTNRTHLADYERAITPNTAAILKVHPSNYRVVGFTAAVPAREVARLALGRHICFIHDLGSGLIEDPPFGVGEPLVRSALEDGADLVTFSGDKLLGGPQAGIIAGRATLVDKLSHHPLLRALRPDKMTLAALEATLDLHLRGRAGGLPLWQMALAPVDELEDRARRLVQELDERLGDGTKLEATPLSSVAGGGSLPGLELPSFGLTISDGERSAAEIQRSLRHTDPPVIVRIEEGRLLVDLRTVPANSDDLLQRLLETALGEGASSGDPLDELIGVYEVESGDVGPKD